MLNACPACATTRDIYPYASRTQAKKNSAIEDRNHDPTECIKHLRDIIDVIDIVLTEKGIIS